MPIYNGYLGMAFPATQGTRQDGLVSPTIFNNVVDNVIRAWLAMTVEDQIVAPDGIGEAVGRCLGVFYSDNSMVGSRDA